MFVDQEYFVGVHETGGDLYLTNKGFLDAISNTSSKHAKLVGQGGDDEGYEDHAWVVLKWKVQIFSRPKACQTYKVRTWVNHCDRSLAQREYKVFDKDGNVCAIATSIWVAYNMSKGSIIRLSPEFIGVYGSHPEEENFPGFKFPRIKQDGFTTESTSTFKILRSMSDCNNHVHNSWYLDIAREALPQEFANELFNDFEVYYKNEVSPSATVKSEYSTDEDGKHYVFIKDESGEILHCIVKMW